MRKEPIYFPEFPGPIEGYVKNFLKSNFWRVEASMEYQDALQEAILVFLKLHAKYGAVDTPQHFMALYKTSLHNHFTDLSRIDSRWRDLAVEAPEDSEDGESLSDRIGEVENAGTLRILIRQAPAEIKTILALLIKAPTEFSSMAISASGRIRAAKLLGFPPGTDVFSMLQQYLTAE